MIATRLTLICHAATSTARMSAFPLDEPIDGRQSDKLAALASLLPRPDRIWVSPAARARQTAEALGFAAAVVAPALRDCDYGRWAGLTLEEVHAAEPEAVASWMVDPGVAPHGGESVLDLQQRVGAWLDDHSGEEGHAVAVTHAAVIRAAIGHAIKATPESFWRIDIGPLSRTLLSWSHNQWRLRAIEPINA